MNEIAGFLKESKLFQKTWNFNRRWKRLQSFDKYWKRWWPGGSTFTFSFIWWRKNWKNGFMIEKIERYYLEIDSINKLNTKSIPS